MHMKLIIIQGRNLLRGRKILLIRPSNQRSLIIYALLPHNQHKFNER